jgi:EmrB/QacA subfamily drug resistance transporter
VGWYGLIAHADTLTNRARLVIMSGVLLALLLSALDQTIVATAMPRIIADLGGLNYYSWVFTAYLLTSTAAMPVFGKLSDLYGRRPFMLMGAFVFIVASAFCGLAQSMPFLIVMRGIQGIGGGAMMVNAFSIVGDLYPPAKRGKWQGLTATTFGFASVLGPALGGYLTDNFSWRWVFYVNLPIGAIALVVIFLTLPRHSGSGRRHTIDYLGVASMVTAMVSILLAFVWAGDLFAWWSAPFFGLLLLGFITGAGFLWVESRAAEPILPLHLFHIRLYSSGVAIMFLAGMAMFGLAVYIPLFMIAVLGSSATGAGIATIPMSVSMSLASTLAGLIIARTGKYKLHLFLSSLLLVFGLFLLTQMGVDTSTPTVYRNVIIAGLGTGAMMPIVTLVVQNAVPYQFLGTATSGIQFFRSIGQTIGVAIYGSIVVARLELEIPRQLTSDMSAPLSPASAALVRNPRTWLNSILPDQLQQELASSTVHGESLMTAIPHALRDAFAASLHDVFLVCGVMAVLIVIAVLTLQEVPLRQSNLEGGVIASSHGEGYVPAPALSLASDEGQGD